MAPKAEWVLPEEWWIGLVSPWEDKILFEGSSYWIMIYDVIKIGVPIWKHGKWVWIRVDDMWKVEMRRNVEIKIVYVNHIEVQNQRVN